MCGCVALTWVVVLALKFCDHDLLFLVLDHQASVALLNDESGLVAQLGRVGSQHALQEGLPLVVVVQPEVVELT